MAKEYKTLIFNDTSAGRTQMAATIDKLANDGWEIKSKEVSDQGWHAGKTCCLGAVFLPLALLGKKDKIITVIMEREKIQVSAISSGTNVNGTADNLAHSPEQTVSEENMNPKISGSHRLFKN